MSSATIVEISVAALSAAIAVFAFIFATRANRAQALSARAAVDAEAYGRAKAIYESAIRTLEEQGRQLHYDITTLQSEVRTLRTQALELSGEIARLGVTNQELRAQVAVLQNRKSA